jgi:DNA-binding CsgD family transcriptional regulator
MATASAAAFQSDRTAMLEALDLFDACDGVGSQEEVLTVGLARVICALMEEDRALAVRELRAVTRLERDNPSTYFLGGRHGVGVLLDVLSGRAGRAEHSVAAATAPGRMRWNRQFLALADAVLCGREGDPEAAEAALARALREAESYPVARNLGLRLVAEPAHQDGWGEPVAWLRQAEHFFHQFGNAAVANACRAALRGMGAPVHQHRTGTDRIPDRLRARGVTVREYEVFVMLADRLGNKDIADALFISPRTVEKHISALITKAGVANRAALCSLAASMRGQ